MGCSSFRSIENHQLDVAACHPHDEQPGRFFLLFSGKLADPDPSTAVNVSAAHIAIGKNTVAYLAGNFRKLRSPIAAQFSSQLGIIAISPRLKASAKSTQSHSKLSGAEA